MNFTSSQNRYFNLFIYLFIYLLSFAFIYLSLLVYNYIKLEKIVISENGQEIVYRYDAHEKRLLHILESRKVSDKTQNTFMLETEDGIKVYVKKNHENKYEVVQESKERFTTPKKVAILYIATGKYIVFWEKFYKEMEEHFLPRHEKTYFLFTDHDEIEVAKNVIKIHQDQLPWPYITFKRYHFFEGIEKELKKFDYIYFLNGTMLPTVTINEEIFPTKEQEVMVTLHPGYFRADTKYLPYDRNAKSKAYIPHHEGKYYVMGGFNGGTSEGFLKLIKIIRAWSDTDIKNNQMPAWHDESMLNRYFLTKVKEGLKPLILIPKYAIPQTGHSEVQELWPYTKMIIVNKALYGGHDWLRSLAK